MAASSGRSVRHRARTTLQNRGGKVLISSIDNHPGGLPACLAYHSAMRESPSTEPQDDAAELEAALNDYGLDARVQVLAFANRLIQELVILAVTGSGLAFVEFVGRSGGPPAKTPSSG